MRKGFSFMAKSVLKVLRVLLVGHLLPVSLFVFTVFVASAVVTACSPTRGSIMKSDAPAAQTNLKASNPTPSASPQSDLQKKLSGTWQCSTPKDASTPCFDQNLVFSDYLDNMSENTFLSLDDGQGKCHVEMNYTLDAEIDSSGNITLNLGTATLGQLIKDPSNADECATDFKNSEIPNLAHKQALTHSDDWTQITFAGVTYTRPATQAMASQAETWPSP
jgi:hypothetical protein